MQPIQKICDHNGICLAIVIRADFSVDKTEFLSDPEYSQQVGIITYPQGGKIKPHIHNELTRQVIFTQEVLVIRKGSVKVDLYDAALEWVSDVVLNTSDVIFLITGGHGFEMMEDCEMLEIKQGPYSGVNNDKTHFEGKGKKE
jgi:hypothetical protein